MNAPEHAVANRITTGGGWSRTKSPAAIPAIVAALLLWSSQPPLRFWPLALVAVIPLLALVNPLQKLRRRDYGWIWGAMTLYWLVSLQGLRHAHPAMYICWMALAAYLAIYPTLFVGFVRSLVAHRVPIVAAAPIAWVGQELLRNYLLTGISAAMLGHTMADVPQMIQIADLAGSYGVGLVIVSVNVALWQTLCWLRRDRVTAVAHAPRSASLLGSIAVAALLVAATLGYGHWRLGQTLGPPLATFALVQRSEPVEYEQSVDREVELFQNYAQQSATAVAGADRDVDVVVWPESMFSGGAPWMTAAADAVVPPGADMTRSELLQGVQQRQFYFVERARYVLDSIAAAAPQRPRPQLLVGCGVVHYADQPQVYSGVVHVSPTGQLLDWYGKTHLVMFGEYVPIAPWVPGLRELVPPGMGLTIGDGAKRFDVAETAVAPNICIETAVERVTVNQLAALRSRNEMADVVVTVTNDGWFDDSSVLQHHLRCAQLVAVGCRRPILSAANNGPTAWIDSRGVVRDSLPAGSEGAVIATPQRDDRISVYLQIGDWPARLAALVCVAAMVRAGVSRRRATGE